MYNVVKCDKDGMTGEMYLGTLRNGYHLSKAKKMTEVKTSLSHLIKGDDMFAMLGNLTKFEQELPSLISRKRNVCGDASY